jgi:membrane protease YdiL (CAAX protease family)
LPGFIALVLTSVAFGLAHFLTLSYALLAALAGLYLGALYWAGGNLVIPIVAHALYDLVALLQLARMYRARRIPD